MKKVETSCYLNNNDSHFNMHGGIKRMDKVRGGLEKNLFSSI